MTKTMELWVGVLTALGLIALFFVAMQVSNLGDLGSSKGSYLLKARFGNVGSLKVRSPVSMAGVTLGRVERISFDGDRFEALVEMRMDPRYAKLPTDTSASILTAGLLGEQYVGLTAGGSEDVLKDGDEIELTQSALVLEQLISKFLFNKAEEGKGANGNKPSADAPVPPPAPLTAPSSLPPSPSTPPSPPVGPAANRAPQPGLHRTQTRSTQPKNHARPHPVESRPASASRKQRHP